MSLSKFVRKVGRGARYATAEASIRLPTMQAHGVEPDIVVSLTTYPARIGSVWKTLETLYRQSLAPSKIILVLSTDEFPGHILPKSVEKFRSYGLEIKYVEGNIRSYKKLIPILAEFPEMTVVTADDDVLYPRRWLEDLVLAHRTKPDHVIGHRGTFIVVSGRDSAPYVQWPQGDSSTPPSRLFLTGLGGILYPPDSLSGEVMNMDLAFQLCPTADDIWFKAMALLMGTPTSKVSDKRGDFITVREAQSSSLRQVNVNNCGNDNQFKAVMDYFSLWGALDGR